MASLTEMKAHVDSAANKLDADIFAYFGDMTDSGAERLCEILTQMPRRRKNGCLILATYGGDPGAAYRIARRIQKLYNTRASGSYKAEGSPEFWCFVPTSCKSAGTIVTLGADKIIISADAELGPIDPQHRKQDEVGERLSGLTPTMALNTLHGNARACFVEHFRKLRSDPKLYFSTKMAAEIATNLTTGLLTPVFEQIDPMRLGEMERSMKVAVDYGQRLDVGNLRPNALTRLLSDYASHGFIIDGDEAEEIFYRVEIAPPELEGVAKDFQDHYSYHLAQDEPFVYILSSTVQPQGGANAGQQDNGTADGAGAGAPDPEGSAAAGEAPAEVANDPQQDGNVVQLGAGGQQGAA